VLKAVKGLKRPGAEPIDVLLAALVAERVDPILARVRGRSQVTELLRQLSLSIQGITLVAQALGVEIDGSRVVEDANFANWPVDRLSKLVRHLQSQVSSLRARADAMEANIKLADQRDAANQEMIKKLIEQINNERGATDGATQHLKDNILRLNTIIAGYHDHDTYLVAVVDPTTGTPSLYFREEEDRIHTVRKLGPATKFSNYEDAHDLRAEIIRARRSKAPRGQHAAIGQSVAVMRVSLRRVSWEDFVEVPTSTPEPELDAAHDDED
jgi:outer membrane murein-binding lipoprotein Lpp